MNDYRIATTEEKQIADVCEDYDLLIGPHGFQCALGEPEDRSWTRDAQPAIEELNRLHRELEIAKADTITLRKFADTLTK